MDLWLLKNFLLVANDILFASAQKPDTAFRLDASIVIQRPIETNAQINIRIQPHFRKAYDV
jgi:hypothetical protein